MVIPALDREKKRAITVIMERIGAGSESGGTGYKKTGETEETRSDTSAAKSGAMHRFLTAVKDENPDEMASALETFYELCSMKHEEEEKKSEGY